MRNLYCPRSLQGLFPGRARAGRTRTRNARAPARMFFSFRSVEVAVSDLCMLYRASDWLIAPHRASQKTIEKKQYIRTEPANSEAEGGGERLIKDLKTEASSLSRGARRIASHAKRILLMIHSAEWSDVFAEIRRVVEHKGWRVSRLIRSR